MNCSRAELLTRNSIELSIFHPKDFFIGKNKGGPARDPLSSFFFRRKTVQQKLLSFGKSSVNTGKDTLGGVCCSGDSFNTLSAVLLNDFRDHVVDRSLNDHVGFSVFEDLNIGNLAAFDNDGNIDLTVVAIALTFVCAVFVGSRSGRSSSRSWRARVRVFSSDLTPLKIK